MAEPHRRLDGRGARVGAPYAKPFSGMLRTDRQSQESQVTQKWAHIRLPCPADTQTSEPPAYQVAGLDD